MSVWVCVPSARPVEHVRAWAAAWRERGYKLALWRDEPWATIPYPGYAVAVNRIISWLIAHVADAQWFVLGGDDVFPDAAHTAEEIAEECRFHFEDLHGGHARLETFGVMQPTGDRWGENALHMGKRGSAYIDRVCGSAWLGREFCRRVNQGKGPLWPEYTHMGVDEELQEVAIKYGVLWQRRDLIHLHQHWGRNQKARVEDMPEFLKKANSKPEWDRYKAIIEARRAAGFPGSELLA